MEECDRRGHTPEELLEYKPGDVVPKSGSYRFVHDPSHAHADPEEISAVKGELFPTCRHCGEGRAGRSSTTPSMQPG